MDKLTIDQLRQLISSGHVTDPLAYLTRIMEGYDPRCYGDLYRVVAEIGAGPPSGAEWAKLYALVMDGYKQGLVSLSDSQAAAKTLAEYVHPKRRSVEVSEGDSRKGSAHVPLTAEEVHIFSETFNEAF